MVSSVVFDRRRAAAVLFLIAAFMQQRQSGFIVGVFLIPDARTFLKM